MKPIGADQQTGEERKMRRKWLSTAMVSLVITIGVFDWHFAYGQSCNTPSEVQKLSVVGDWLPWSAQGPIVAAQEKGFYKEEGLEVNLISPATFADPIKLVARQRADLALSYVPDVMVAQDTGIPVISIAAWLRPLSYGMVVSPELKSPQDFKGKIVGVGNLPGTRAYFRTMLETAGVQASDVEVADPGYSNVKLLVSGNLPAISGLTFGELVAANREAEKAGKPPFQFWPFDKYGVPPMYFMVVVGADPWVKSHPAATCRFMRATKKGYEEFAKNPDPYNQLFAKNNKIFDLEEHTAMSKRVVKDFLGPNGELFTQDPMIWKEAQDWAAKQKLITVGGTSVEAYYTNDFVQK
jgi:putative hydroxymethylpyrimidine transport system substrate-binding protein